MKLENFPFLPGDIVQVGPAWRMGPYTGHPGSFVNDGSEGLWLVCGASRDHMDVKATRDLDACPRSDDHLDFLSTRRCVVVKRAAPELTFLGCILPYAMNCKFESARRAGWQFEADLLFGV